MSFFYCTKIIEISILLHYMYIYIYFVHLCSTCKFYSFMQLKHVFVHLSCQVVTSIPTQHLPKKLQWGAGLPPPMPAPSAAGEGPGEEPLARGQILWVRGLTRLQTQVNTQRILLPLRIFASPSLRQSQLIPLLLCFVAFLSSCFFFFPFERFSISFLFI